MVKQKVSEYLDWVRASKNDAERQIRRAEFKSWYVCLTVEQQNEAQTVLKQDRNEIRIELRSIREEVEMLMKGTYREAS